MRPRLESVFSKQSSLRLPEAASWIERDATNMQPVRCDLQAAMELVQPSTWKTKQCFILSSILNHRLLSTCLRSYGLEVQAHSYLTWDPCAAQSVTWHLRMTKPPLRHWWHAWVKPTSESLWSSSWSCTTRTYHFCMRFGISVWPDSFDPTLCWINLFIRYIVISICALRLIFCD